MTITDCPWEIENIGKTTVEINISPDDVFDHSCLTSTNNYDYVVVKVPMKKIDYNRGLGLLGFTMMENQMKISKKLTTVYHDSITDHVSFEELKPDDDIRRIVKNMTPSMFSTDRITLDNEFGPLVGMRRYANWLISDFNSGKSRVAIVKYYSDEVGFMMFRILGNTFHLLLNGLYEPWQGKHLGIITPSSPETFIHQHSLQANMVETTISSNNIPVVKLYSRIGFEVSSQTYVFTKHNS